MAHAHPPADASPAPPATRRLLAGLLAPFAVATAVGLVVLWPRGEAGAEPPLGAPEALYDATVVAVERGACPGTEPEAGIRCARLRVRLAEGPDAGQEVDLPELAEGGGAIRPDVGDGVVVGYTPEAVEGLQYYFADLERRSPLAVLAALFAVAVVLLGRWQGLRALLGLGISLLVVIVFVLPAVLQGSSPLAVALVGAAAIAFMALSLAHGVNARTATALLGTLTSLALIGVLAAAFVAASRFSGLGEEEASLLQISAAQVDLRGLLLGGIVIGALGVLDDVTVTQASAVWELRQANPAYGVTRLYRSALAIGRDHIASTVNTLVLAYAGASLPLLLLFTQADQALSDVLNGEVVAVELVRTLVGSIGLVASVPLTTALAALAASRQAEPAAATPTPAPAPPDRAGRARPSRRRSRSRAEERFWRDR